MRQRKSPCRFVATVLAISMTYNCDENGGQSPIQGSISPWGHTCGFYAAVKAFMEIPKALVVRAVAGLVNVQQRKDQTGSLMITPYATGRLDVFCCCLGLAHYHHQPKPGDVQPDRDHIRCERNIDGVF